MKAKLFYSVALGAAATTAAGQARAQIFNFDMEISHSASPAGAPQAVDSIGFLIDSSATTTGERHPVAGDYTAWSTLTNDTYASTFGYYGSPLEVLWITPTPISEGLSSPFFDEIPAATDFSNGLNVQFADYAAIGEFIETGLDQGFSDYDFNYSDECFQVARDGAFRVGVSHTTVSQRCDALSLNFGLDDLEFEITSDENSPDLTLKIPDIGLDYTTDRGVEAYTLEEYRLSQTGALPSRYEDVWRREEAWAQLGNYLLESGNDKEIAAALLGTSVDNLPELGALPTGGDFLSLKVQTTSASPAGSLSTQALGDGIDIEFGASSLGQILAYGLVNIDAELADFGLDNVSFQNDCQIIDGEVIGVCDGAEITLGVLGVSAKLSSEENSPNITLTSSDLGVSYSTSGATDREAALEDVEQYVIANEDEITKNFYQSFQEVQIATQADNPIAGNPQSLQGTLTSNLLTLDTPSSILMEETGDLTDEASSDDSESMAGGKRAASTSSWMVGGRVGTFTAGEEEGQFLDISLERGFRVGEGSRDRVKVSVPISFLDFAGETQSTGSVRVGYEKVLAQDKWVVEPSLGLGYAFETDKYAAGALWSAGLSSRFKVSPVGKGHIIVGNAIGYSESFDIESGDSFKTPDISNVSFRNGLAYQVPVGERVFGRMGTLRTSYSYTFIEGDELFLDEYHDVSLNYGVGSREATVRNFTETMRIGIGATFGDDYESFSLNAGYRF